MIVLALTGSIAMGKSTVAAMFEELGCPVFNADQAVHEAYAPGGVAVAPVLRLFPDVACGKGGIDRQKLAARVIGDDKALKALEAIVHPLVAEARARFLRDAEQAGHAMVILDIPLLFETGGDDGPAKPAGIDRIAVVSAPADVQRKRALARPGMTVEKLDAILDRQMPDALKRQRADYVIDTGGLLADTRRQVEEIAETITGQP